MVIIYLLFAIACVGTLAALVFAIRLNNQNQGYQPKGYITKETPCGDTQQIPVSAVKIIPPKGGTAVRRINENIQTTNKD